MYGVEAAGRGLDSGEHAATLARGHVGVLHGNKTYLLARRTRTDPHDALDLRRARLPGRRTRAQLPEGSRPRGVRRGHRRRGDRRHCGCSTETEGIIPALESAHAIAFAARLAPTLDTDKVVIVNLSGRGDKDMATVADAPRE